MSVIVWSRDSCVHPDKLGQTDTLMSRCIVCKRCQYLASLSLRGGSMCPNRSMNGWNIGLSPAQCRIMVIDNKDNSRICSKVPVEKCSMSITVKKLFFVQEHIFSFFFSYTVPEIDNHCACRCPSTRTSADTVLTKSLIFFQVCLGIDGVATCVRHSEWPTKSRKISRHFECWNTCLQCGSPLKWRHNGCDSVSNHQPHDCLLNRLFRRRSKKTPKLRVTGLCAGNSPGTGEFPAQMASYAENVSIWWRHHAPSILLRWQRSTQHSGLYC